MQEHYLQQEEKRYQEFRKDKKYSQRTWTPPLNIVLFGEEVVTSTLARECAETFRFPQIDGKLLEAENYLARVGEQAVQALPGGVVVWGDLQGKEVSKETVDVLSRQGLPVHVFNIDSEKRGGEVGQLDFLSNHHINVKGSLEEITRDFFLQLSPLVFKKNNLVEKYYYFHDLCQGLGSKSVLVTGACTYYYQGRRPLEDIDTVVSGVGDLEKISASTGRPLESTTSKVGMMNYVNLGEVDVLSDLRLAYKNAEGNSVYTNFPFEELAKGARKVRLFGLPVMLTSPEVTVLMKIYLGRYGVDDWGLPKDDYEDARGVVESQKVDFPSLKQRARELGMLERFALGERILKSII